jgi:hypothetical protein
MGCIVMGIARNGAEIQIGFNGKKVCGAFNGTLVIKYNTHLMTVGIYPQPPIFTQWGFTRQPLFGELTPSHRTGVGGDHLINTLSWNTGLTDLLYVALTGVDLPNNASSFTSVIYEDDLTGVFILEVLRASMMRTTTTGATFWSIPFSPNPFTDQQKVRVTIT